MKLPKLLEKYVKASNENDVNSFISCFSERAILADNGEKESVTGKKAIAHWFSESRKKFDFQTEVTDSHETTDELFMKAKVTGNFKGSPIIFNYHFKLDAGLIVDLKIDMQ